MGGEMGDCSNVLTKPVPENMHGRRFDQVLASEFPQYSRSRLQQWVRAGLATVAGRTRRPRDAVHQGEILEIRLPSPATGSAQFSAEAGIQSSGWEPQPIALDIVHEDDALLVVNKPPGLVVHPGAGNPRGTLVNALVHYDSRLQHLPRAGLVHRLDKETSGLLLVARSFVAHTRLVRLLAQRAVRREYLGVVWGRITAGGHVDAPIGRHPSKRTHMAVVQGAREALTHYRVAERFRVHTLARIRLESGRTHQIRVHLAHLGHPLVGDPLYGGRARQVRRATPELADTLAAFRRQALHATTLGLTHPDSGDDLQWYIPPPEDFKKLLEVLRDDHAQVGDGKR